ncbi:MAG: DEAD/DEAH box helicase, partial [Peptoniphilaceae bacterium]|nr:DEAD/DEAH box helicase [Peptoniphilaceae bacterium]
MKLENKLKEFFGYDNFKKGQKEIIEKILERKDVLGILPTGGGKSICYQLPALLM